MLYIPVLCQVLVVYRRQIVYPYVIFYSIKGSTKFLYIVCFPYHYRRQIAYPYTICPLYSTGKVTKTAYFYLMPTYLATFFAHTDSSNDWSHDWLTWLWQALACACLLTHMYAATNMWVTCPSKHGCKWKPTNMVARTRRTITKTQGQICSGRYYVYVVLITTKPLFAI